MPPMAVTRLSVGATFEAHLSNHPLSAAKAKAVRNGKNKNVSRASGTVTTSGELTIKIMSNQIYANTEKNPVTL